MKGCGAECGGRVCDGSSAKVRRLIGGFCAGTRALVISSESEFATGEGEGIEMICAEHIKE